jgi:dolichol-phosphate mannosyltransferase
MASSLIQQDLYMSKTIVVIPTFNEIENVAQITEALLALKVPNLGVLIVDDNSPDGTGQRADELVAQYPDQVHVLHRKERNGFGPAYVAGFKKAISLGADNIIQMDADFSHQPKYIPEMIALVEKGNDLVIGSRYAKGGGVDEQWSIYRKLLSWFANRVYVPTLLGIPIHDATAGFRLWRRQTLVGLDLDRIRSTGYVFQVELAYVTHRLGFKIDEVPIYFPDRKWGISKMNSRIQIEAALRVWQVMARHRALTPQMRRTEVYSS